MAAIFMSDVTLRIHTEDGKTHHAETPLEIKAKDFINEIVEGLGLSTSSVWSLYNKGMSAFLDPDKTLGQNRVSSGQDLYLNRRRSQRNTIICQNCRTENSAENRVCQSCGKPLVHGRGSSDIKIRVHMPNGSIHLAEVPSTLIAKELIAELVRAVGVAVKDSTGAPIGWKLDDKDSDRALVPEWTLGENGVHNDHDLYLRAPDQPPPRPQPKPMPLWIIAAVLGVLVLVGITAIFAFHPRPKPVPVTLSVNPAAVTLRASQRQEFKASVTGSDNQMVQWSVEPAIGTISPDGLYRAPVSVLTEQSVRITATSKADPRVSAIASVTLKPVPKPPAQISVAVVPMHASVSPGQQQEFIARVTGTENRTVQWSVSPPIGSISADGMYLAPSSVPVEQAVKITAISKADSHKSASVVLTLLSNVLVKVYPVSVTLAAGKKQKFKSSVTGTENTSVEWSISPMLGSISEKGEYKAPSSVSPGQIVKVTATSKADQHKSAGANVTLK
jgi:WXG100 protein secretion system (Wss), protein YukD